jgi:hypothetical protein
LQARAAFAHMRATNFGRNSPFAGAARMEERKAPPLYEVLADTFNLTSPRFASIRPRLVTHLRYAIANLKVHVQWDPGGKRKIERAREILDLLNPEPRRACASCGKLFLPTRRDAVTCSPACRQREYRKRVTNKASALVDP